MTKNSWIRFLFITAAFGLLSPVPVLSQKSADSLHERAKKAGGRLNVRYRPNRSVIYPNIEELAKRSDLIIVGRTLLNRSSLRADGRFITRDFLVKIHEVIKGDVKGAGSIFVSMPGGIFRFPDGSFASIRPVAYTPTENDKLYVFFLKQKGSTNKGHELVSESQAVFCIENGKVQPSDQIKDDPIVMKYTDMSTANFLSEIHKAVPRTRKKS